MRGMLRAKMKTIVLASSSPRRKEILEKTGLKFISDASDYEEKMNSSRNPRALARLLSRQKAKSMISKYKNAVIIAADTFIQLGGELMGKPRTEEQAAQMLMALSGKMHRVITGFTIVDTDTCVAVSRSVETKVFFKRVTIKEVESYIKSGEPLDKAGAYAIQGLGAVFVKRIEGDYFNVMGLPLGALVESLKRFGVHVLI
ncbi:MAG: Maf family protein [Dissulfurispiraceae bacterium]